MGQTLKRVIRLFEAKIVTVLSNILKDFFIIFMSLSLSLGFTSAHAQTSDSEQVVKPAESPSLPQKAVVPAESQPVQVAPQAVAPPSPSVPPPIVANPPAVPATPPASQNPQSSNSTNTIVQDLDKFLVDLEPEELANNSAIYRNKLRLERAAKQGLLFAFGQASIFNQAVGERNLSIAIPLSLVLLYYGTKMGNSAINNKTPDGVLMEKYLKHEVDLHNKILEQNIKLNDLNQAKETPAKLFVERMKLKELETELAKLSETRPDWYYKAGYGLRILLKAGLVAAAGFTVVAIASDVAIIVLDENIDEHLVRFRKEIQEIDAILAE